MVNCIDICSRHLGFVSSSRPFVEHFSSFIPVYVYVFTVLTNKRKKKNLKKECCEISASLVECVWNWDSPMNWLLIYIGQFLNEIKVVGISAIIWDRQMLMIYYLWVARLLNSSAFFSEHNVSNTCKKLYITI